MRVMTCLAVFFLAFTLLLQDNLGSLQMELNYRNYGRWFAFDDDGVYTRYPYLEKSGEARVGSIVYSLFPISYTMSEGPINDLAPTVETVNDKGDIIKEKPPISDGNGAYLPPLQEITVENFGDRRTTNCHIGTYSDGFVSQNGIRLYEGHMPENDNEIVMELGVLHSLGVSYELGQEISFYVSENEPVFVHDGNAGNAPVHSPEDYYLKLHLVSFKLVGTLERYTARWNGGTLLPGAIITNSAFSKLPSFENSYDFYDLKPGVGGEKVWEFAATSFKGFESWRSGLYERLGLKSDEKHPAEEWNHYAYTNPLWGSSGVYRYVTVILMIMGACVLAYLMAAYLSKRRQFFMRMREIGATTAEVWRMAGYECVVSALPHVAVSLAGAYLTALIASAIVSNALCIDYKFTFKYKTLFIILAAILLVLAVSLAAALAIYSGRGISERKKALSKSSAAAFRAKAARRQQGRRPYLSLSETLKRTRRIHALKTALVRIACVLIGAMILLAFMEVYAQTSYYLQLKNSDSDLSGNLSDKFVRHTYGDVDTELHWNVTKAKRIDHDKADLAVSRSELSFQNMLGERFFGELESIPGIKRIVRGAVDADHTLSWGGKGDGDAFLEECIMRGLESASNSLGYKLIYNGKRFDAMRSYVDNSLYLLQCFDNFDPVWEAAKPYLCAEANREAFLRGEQVIVFVDESLYCVNRASNQRSSEYAPREEYALTSENLWKRSPSFTAGDTVYINNLNKDGRQTSVTVAAVLPMTDYVQNDICTIYSEDYLPVFVTVGSMELARRVQETDDLEFGANVFGVKLDSIAESENSLKFISALCVNNHVRYEDTVEVQIESRNYWIDVILTYGFFTIVLFILYAFIVSSIAKEDELSLAPNIQVLHRAGIPLSQMRRQKSFDALIQSLWQLLSIPLFALIHFAPNLLKLGSEAQARQIGKLDYVLLLIKSWFSSETTDKKAIAAVIIVLMIMLWLINRRIRITTDTSERSK